MVFSIVDVCAILTDSNYQAARNYWKWLKTKLKDEGSELVSDSGASNSQKNKLLLASELLTPR